MTDIAPIKGLIELQDDFTSKLGLAEAALGNFTKVNQESLKAVAGAAGLVVAAVGAITVATIELGKRGSDVNDVNNTLEHFAGGARQAEEAMSALRAGTLDTVDNFVLAKDAAHLLSAGVKLTAEDFGTLGAAAFALSDRGLGDTEKQLELVSDALVTGRTRALSMALGVIDAGDAEENYAKQLGITKDQLSEAGKVESHRIEVMRILKDAVKDAGEQERDFGDELKFAQAQVTNWVDELGSAIASSEVFKQGFKGIETAVAGAFGKDKNEAIKATVGFIEQGAITLISFAQAAIVMAKTVEGAWNGVRTVVLGLETVVVGLATGIISAISLITEAAAKLHIISPEAAQGVADLRINLDGMTQSLKDQTIEAGKSVFGHTEFDSVLDKLSDTLGKTKAAMLSAKDATAEGAKTNDIAAENVRKLAATQAELTARMIDQVKVQAALDKSTKELNVIWSDYYNLVAKSSGTTRDAQIADINATFDKQVGALDKMDPLYQQKYDAYKATAKASLDAIGNDWDSVKDKSNEGLQEMADKALETYNMMSTSSLTFSREALDEQFKKYHDLADAARGYGKEVVDATSEATNGIRMLDHAWVADADIAADTINRTTTMVRTLSGEVISLMEAQRRQQQGFSFETPPVDQFEIDRTPGGADALLAQLSSLSQTLGSMKDNIHDFASQAAYFSAVARYNALRSAYNLLISQSSKPKPAPKFAEGGTVAVQVGEQGPETVRLPLGSTVYPTGMMPPGMGNGVTIHNTWHVNGTGAMVAREVSNIIMGQLKRGRQFGSA